MANGVAKQNGRRWSAEIAEAMLAAHGASGMSMAEFARDRGVDVQRLYFWRRQLSRRAPSTNFVEVARPEQLIVDRRATFEVELRSGDVVRVSGEFDKASFRKVVEVLRSC